MKNIADLPSAPAKLATPNEIGQKGLKSIAAVLNPLIADVFTLYVKTKNYHWHVSGSHYRDYHLLLDEQASQIFEMIDVLAERVRKLGGLTIHSIKQIKSLQHIQDDDSTFVKPRDMLKNLMNDNRLLEEEMRKAHKVCAEYYDVATTSVLEVYIDETERRIWFLYETLAE